MDQRAALGRSVQCKITLRFGGLLLRSLRVPLRSNLHPATRKSRVLGTRACGSKEIISVRVLRHDFAGLRSPAPRDRIGLRLKSCPDACLEADAASS
jgi:hypothetical protein